MSFGWNPTTCDNAHVKPTLREILAESHISAVTIAVLLLWSFDSAFRAIAATWGPFFRVAEYLATAVAIRDIPSLGPFIPEDRIILFVTFSYLFSGFVSLVSAWLLARWVYGDGPLRSLSRYRRIAGRNHV
jgi:hypothetical protein